MTKLENHNDLPFNQKFCDYLEFHLCQTFQNTDQQDLKGFWCDGVSCDPTPNHQLSKKSVNDTRRIVTKAWMGKNGQEEYEMTIQFGQQSLRRYARGNDIIDCIPSSESMDWMDINIEKKKIEIRLK